MLVGDVKEIKIRGEVVSIRGDYDGGERSIYMDVTTHTGAPMSEQGHSIGKWEGKDLIVDTTHFSAHILGNGVGLPSSPKKHLIERFSFSADGKSLLYSFELTDPEYLASALTLDVEWAFRPDLDFLVEDCDLENAGRFLQN